ncbi:hypothetical protein HZA76_01360 [Candidatus Roizmanbacteria bacterium]|nr:hypothetical protein [Candidatus Roizmanbacteria bacterium]
MAEKIKGNYLSITIWLLLIGLLVYTRFVNLGWGLPFPMHPDERNMANAVQQLNCQLPEFKLNLPKSFSGNWEPVTSWLKITKPFDPSDCLNPRFFAYGQFPLFLGYALVWLIKFIKDSSTSFISFQEATMGLRIVSASASLMNSVVLFKIILLVSKRKVSFKNLLFFLVFIFSPFAIQFAHFGTTESLLIFFYSLIIYLSLSLKLNKISVLPYVLLTSFFIGLSLATKVSSIIFIAVPVVTIFSKKNSRFPHFYWFVTSFFDTFIIGLISILVFVIFSPHNIIHWQEFIGSIKYESDVALGKYTVFYTRQFVDTIPVWFQFTKVFPYALGWGVSLMGLIGLIGLSWKDKQINLLRFAFIIYFLPNAFLFTKWTRFMAPVFPLITIFAILFLSKLYDLSINLKQKALRIVLNAVFLLFILIFIFPGLSYLSIYKKPDIRYQASEWIYKNIPNNSYILSETANVIDIPINLESYEARKIYNVVPFNFYDLDENLELEQELKEILGKVDYIFVPSRRLFANHSKSNYPLLNQYYDKLFSGELGFIKVAEFSSGLNDETAEETWTVFDHPVIRIFKRVKSS